MFKPSRKLHFITTSAYILGIIIIFISMGLWLNANSDYERTCKSQINTECSNATILIRITSAISIISSIMAALILVILFNKRMFIFKTNHLKYSNVQIYLI